VSAFSVDAETARPASSRRRGMGRTFLRHNTWWIAYCINGKERRESARSADPEVAEQLLEERLRDPMRAQRQRHRMARLMFERFTKVTLIDLLTDSVRALSAEMRKSGRPVPGVYFMRSGEFIKIGYASDLNERRDELQTGNPTEIELLAIVGESRGRVVFGASALGEAPGNCSHRRRSGSHRLHG
jgi:hypothetical protein